MKKLMRFASLAFAFTFAIVMFAACGGTRTYVANLEAVAGTSGAPAGMAMVEVSFQVPKSDDLGGGIIRILDKNGDEADSVYHFWVNSSSAATRFHGLMSDDEITFKAELYVDATGTYTVEVTLGYGDPADAYLWETKWELGRTITKTVEVTEIAEFAS